MASFAVFCFAFLALSSQQLLANAQSDLITTTCDKTMYKDVCKSTFAAIPESKNADLNGLAKIALHEANKQAKDIQAKILELSQKSSDKQKLNDCSNNYQHAIVQFEDSLKALDSKTFSDVNQFVTAAMSDAESCEGASALTDLHNKFKSLCSIVLTISNVLDGKA